MPYYIILTSIFILFFLSRILRMDRKANIIITLILILFSSLRYEVGTDFKNYTDIYTHSPKISEISFLDIFTSFYEPLFFLSNAILKEINLSNEIFFTYYASITFIVLNIGLNKLKNTDLNFNINISYIIYFLVFLTSYAFNGMRQAIAMSFFILSIPFIINNRFFIVTAISLIAASFHTTGLLIIICYILKYVFKKIKTPFLINLIIIVSASIILNEINFSQNIFLKIFPNQKEVYSEIFNEPIGLESIALRGLLLLIIISPFFLGKISDSHKLLIYVYTVGFSFYIAMSDLGMLTTRFNMFFRTLEIILIPILLKFRPYTISRIIFSSAIILYLFVFNHTINFEDNIYRTIFSK